MPKDLVHRAAFESQGEAYVRKLAQQGGDVGSEAVAWLGEQQSLREEVASAKRNAREEETLSIAKEANAFAKEANRLASEDLAAARSSASTAERAATAAERAS